MIDEWRPVVGWQGFYEVARDGRVRSVPRVCVRRNGTTQPLPGRLLRHQPCTTGYVMVNLNDKANGRLKCAKVHRLVAEAFIPNPDGLPEVNHKDSDRGNPHFDNLEWVTRSQNRKHAYAAGNLHPPRKYRFTAEERQDIRAQLANGATKAAIARAFGVCWATVARAAQGDEK